MKRRVNTILGQSLTLILVALACGCSQEPGLSDQVAAAPAEPGPEDAIQEFYDWYVHYPGNPLTDGILGEHPAVSDGLVEKVDGIMASFHNRGGYDPILCAQDIPQAFAVEVIDRSIDSASAVVRTGFEGHEIYVGVLRVDGIWMIADVTCPVTELSVPAGRGTATATPSPAAQETSTPASGETTEVDARTELLPGRDSKSGWAVFQDADHGFQIAHPEGWATMDLPVYDRGIGAPPTVIQRFVILYPQEWEERLDPSAPPDPNVSSYPALSIEVCRGSLEAYRREFLELGSREAIEINGTSAFLERDTQDDYNVIRYVFSHPADDELIVSLTDVVNGFSARIAESGEVAELIPQVVATFAFAE